ncbi:TPA: hypothetical protein NU789_003193 [Acinetobacter baumannii]|uniref:zonular occludens toxin domain-containing protein n=3 Tax=Acinetobacter baumannii TaxID=470 RepID=UPI000D017458|nr:zonular occludens toxin domain-containing protein [Acinetobacter baumannii]MDA4921860.1 hypothetical protein [Acinetobacter baumannii]MDT1779766.1 zonular occludens toxin domain-containing protein [Acinetobacter baumannii]PRO08517.1 hypothetical protein B9W31_19865 [Acinetobacter baumannii]PRO26453.1 hypothetical protein B9W57_09740 [Acinetobacter baumannii]TLT20419.1 hypothetical protein FD872_19460 [Acinetobacter baumannii]
MPIALLTSPPGTGKTLKAVEIIFQKLAEGYIVYSNIIGLKIPGVFPLDFNCDWRDLDNFKRQEPELAHKPIYVVVDECHEWFVFGAQYNKSKIKEIQDTAAEHKKTLFEIAKQALQRFNDCLAVVRKTKSRKVTDDEVEEPFYISCEDYAFYEEQRAALSMHRHFGFDFLLVTQEVSKLNKTVRDFVSLHMHMRRPFNLPYATVFHFREAQDSIGLLTYTHAERKERFKYPKYLFDFYTSTNINSIKSTPPWFWIGFLGVVLAALLYVAYQLFFVGLFHNEETNSTSSPVATEVATDPQLKQEQFNTNDKVVTVKSLEIEELSRPAMIIESSDSCKMTNSKGDVIVTDLETCKKLNSRASNLSFSKLDRSSVHSHSNYSNNSSTGDTTTPDSALVNEPKTYS